MKIHTANTFSRIALFVIYFWFGVLKLFDTSPANPLVASLLEKTLPFISFPAFIVLLGMFEMVIGILFLFPQMRKIALPFFVLHMFTTIMPLLLLPQVAWNGFLIPTLEGQYIIKNLALIGLVFNLEANQK